LFERQRVGTTIGRVIDNVYNFIRLRNESYPHVQIRVSMVMYKEPKWLEQFEGLKIMWKGLVDAVGFGFYTERDPDARGEYPEVPGFWCAQPFQRMFLKYNGNVTVCCVDDKDEMVVGNWHKDKLYDIWHGAEFARIRRLHAAGQYRELPLCRKCYLPVSE
jgi:radical SAM protein with 4Fe4S-binding SPASM domain